MARKDLRGISKRKLLRSTLTTRCVMEYQSAVHSFDCELRKAKRKFSHEKITEIDSLIKHKNPKLFWDEVNKLGPKKRKQFVREALDHNGNVTRDPDIVRKHWFCEFSKLYGDQPQGEFDNDFYLEKMLDLQERPMDDNPQVELNCNISLTEVRNSVMAGKLRKSCGCDLIPYEALKNGPCIEALHKLFNTCFASGCIPSEWRKCEIVPIPKGNKSISTEPLTYRGLGLQSCIYKSYSYILNRRLTNYLETRGLINETQNGFRPDRGC